MRASKRDSGGETAEMKRKKNKQQQENPKWISYSEMCVATNMNQLKMNGFCVPRTHVHTIHIPVEKCVANTRTEIPTLLISVYTVYILDEYFVLIKHCARGSVSNSNFCHEHTHARTHTHTTNIWFSYLLSCFIYSLTPPLFLFLSLRVLPHTFFFFIFTVSFSQIIYAQYNIAWP